MKSPSAPRLRPLLDFVPAASPKFTRPEHLAAVAALFERAARGSVRAVISLPPRHGKTELVKHAVAWWLLAQPAKRIIYASYSADFAKKKSREMRALYARVDGKLASDARARHDWRTGIDDGGLWATSVEGSVTGEGGDILLVDDPVKDRAVAESAAERQKIFDWFQDTLSTRAEPGASIFVVQTRWHPDDLAGRLIAAGWEHVTLPALDDAGEALWPERFGAASLSAIRESLGEYSFASLYQGSPLPRGGALFRDVQFYDAPPAGPMRVIIGVDLAYTTRSRSDWSVAVVVGERDGVFHVLEVVRLQVGTPEFLAALLALRDRHGGAPVTGFFGGSETGVLDLFRAGGLHVHSRNAVADKFTRAQPVAAAWNTGRVLLPRLASWLNEFVAEVVSFTGRGDRHDDQVDALAGAFEHAGGTFSGQRIGDHAFKRIATKFQNFEFFGPVANAATAFRDLPPEPTRTPGAFPSSSAFHPGFRRVRRDGW